MAFVTENVDVNGKKLFIFRGGEILIDSEGRPCGGDVLGMIDPECVKQLVEDTAAGCCAAALESGTPAPEGCSFVPLRTLFAVLRGEDAIPPARMKAVAGFVENTRFCPSCSAALSPHESEGALVCKSCGRVLYPRIEPCVIAVICKGDEILLLRHVQRNQDMWCCLAGFVEAGESLEHALVREVREEVGIEIDNIRYAGSQSWPFPFQLMVGFYADWAGGDINVDGSEIFEARWFRRDDLPVHPPKGSISWNLIHFEKAEF